MATELTRESIVALLEKNDKAVARALIVINNNQTNDERVERGTKYRNGMGFRPCHARMGTSMALFYERNQFLSPKQIAYWRKRQKDGSMRIAIYWRQLIDAAMRKSAVVT